MSFYRGMTCENVTIKGDKGTPITAYVARPAGPGPFPGVVLIHHLPGWSELYIETTRRFAHHGYLAICANLYEREGGGSDGNPDDVAAKVRAEGGIADSQMVGDTEGAVKWMRAQKDCNGKVGLIGSCSGGRHAFIYACQKHDVDAVVEQWGGGVVMSKEELNAKKPVAPIDMTKDLGCPILGLFGNDDRAPSPEQVNQHEAELKKHGKNYEFHRYDGAGHGFFYWHRPLYRPEQAMDGWNKIWAFESFLFPLEGSLSANPSHAVFDGAPAAAIRRRGFKADSPRLPCRRSGRGTVPHVLVPSRCAPQRPAIPNTRHPAA